MAELRTTALHYLLVISFLPVAARAGKELNFDNGRFEQGLMPDGCGNPFRESNRFIEFFDAAISTMAAERGANAKGVADLFGVKYVRDLIAEESGFNGAEESGIDRLIVTQLCHYEKISTQKSMGTPGKSLQIFAKDPGLHDHLAGIAKKLFSDSVSLYRAEKKALAKSKDQHRFVISRQQEIRKAKNLGEDKVRNLIE